MRIRDIGWLGCFMVLMMHTCTLQAQTRDQILKKLQDRGIDLGERFRGLDKNANGQLERSETNPKLFEMLDLDGDNVVDLAEATRAIRERGVAAIQEAAKASGTSPSSAEVAKKPAAEQPPTSTASQLEEHSPGATPIQEGVQRLIAGEHRIGQRIADLKLIDLQGNSLRLSQLNQDKLLVIAFTNTTCPVCKKYAPTLASLERAYQHRGVNFLYVNPTASDKLESIQAARQQHGLQGTYVRDADGSIAMALGAMKTTDVFVLDTKRTLLYRGAIDDQYGFGYSTDAAKHHYLRNALEATLANEPLLIAATSAPGCPLNLMAAPKASATEITYHNRISRIIQQKCLECHRDGGVAPFGMTSYDEVVAQQGAILQVLEKGVMPPWFAASENDEIASPFINDCSLSKTEKRDLIEWLQRGTPEGNSEEAPVPRTFITDWQIGKPDQIIQIEKPISVKATGTMPYQNVTVDTGFTEDKYVQALEVRPTAREVVHHILVFVVPEAKSGRGILGRGKPSHDEDDDETNGFFAAYAPGYDALSFDEGMGKVIPAGARLKFQIHYTPNGTATQDQPMLAMRFCKEPPQKLLNVVGVSQIRLAIPPHAANHEVVATQVLPKEASISAFFPHLHLRGKAFRYEALLPSGETKLLLDIPRYDFNWQLSYRLAEPLTLPQGTTIRATAWYDNSSANLANPDPTRTVRWGPQTTDEMMIGYVEYHMEGATMGRGKQLAEFRERIQEGVSTISLFDRFDTNKNGRLDSQEIPDRARDMILKLDTDGDGAISKSESERLKKLRL